MDNDQFENLELLNRSVVNKDGFVCLNTDEFEGFKYAFYLSHPKGLEKVFYTKNTECIFDVCFKKGAYIATFFYMNEKGHKKSFKLNFSITEEGDVVVLKKTLLGETKGWKIDYYDQGSEITFIVFNGSGSSKNSSPFGLGYLRGKGFNIIACLQDNDHYQSLSFDDFKNCVLPVVKGKDVFLYGSSLGGYCAVYYAGAVNGTVIASAPRNSSHPDIIARAKGKSRFNTEDFCHANIKENPITNKNIFVFIDPYVEGDMYFLDNFVRPAYKELNYISFEHAGHEVLFHINKTKQLDGIITSIVLGEKNFDVDRSIDSCFTYIGKARHYLNKRDYSKAVSFAEKALEENGLSDKLRSRFEKTHHMALKRKVSSEANI